MELSDLQKRVDDYAADCHDSIASSKAIGFSRGRTLAYPEDNFPLFGVNTLNTAVMNDWAVNQICGKLDAPAGWIYNEKHCPENLAVDIMNKLVIERQEAKLLLRLKGDTVRAVLSDQYTKFDNGEVVELVQKAVSAMGVEPTIVRAQADDELAAYALFPQVTVAQDPRDTGRGGQLHPAIFIGNSERGGGKAKICAAVFSSFCQNGMIVGYRANEILAIRHRYISHDGMLAQVADAIGTALELSEAAGKKFAESVEYKLAPLAINGIVDRWAKTYGLTVDAQTNWLGAITGEANRNGRSEDPRLFDVVNAATWIAQQYQPAEAVGLEAMAGDILDHYLPVRAESDER
jgi:hypothetical protein